MGAPLRPPAPWPLLLLLLLLAAWSCPGSEAGWTKVRPPQTCSASMAHTEDAQTSMHRFLGRTGRPTCCPHLCWRARTGR
jgi:hypothetical protein